MDDITLDIPAGKMVGLIGPDGVGKSTLLAIIAGVRILQQGEATILGGNVADAGYRESMCARVAYMPQGLGKIYIRPCRFSRMSISLAACSDNRARSGKIESPSSLQERVCPLFANGQPESSRAE